MKIGYLQLLIIGILAALGAGCSEPVTSEHWRQDLRTLERQLAERHVDLYHSVSEAEFRAAADSLYERIPTLSRPEILIGFAQLTLWSAMVTPRSTRATRMSAGSGSFPSACSRSRTASI